MTVQLEKAVEAVRRGMDIGAAAKKFNIDINQLAQALNPKGGGAPVDSFKSTTSHQNVHPEDEPVCALDNVIHKVARWVAKHCPPVAKFLPPDPADMEVNISIRPHSTLKDLSKDSDIPQRAIECVILKEIELGRSAKDIQNEADKYNAEFRQKVYNALKNLQK